ncbi:MAG: TIGR02186 family protein [Gemmatimonadota bacterium]
MSRTAWPAALLGLVLAHGPLWAQAGAEGRPANPLGSLTVSERDIRITPRYAGVRVQVRGTVQPGFDVVVRLASDGRMGAFSRMGKVGPFWMSVGRMRVGNVPEMYKIKSNRPLQAILSGPEQVAHVLGFRGLRASFTVDSGNVAGLYINELIAARKAAGLFAFSDSGVMRHGERFATSFYWPAGAPPGRYTVQAFAVRNQQVVGSRSVPIDVREVGLEAFVSDFAGSHGILYGLAAVMLGAGIGWLMSLLFDAAAKLRPGRTPAPPSGDAATKTGAPGEA